LSKKQREKLAPIIHEQALAVGLGWVTPEELDISGITMAVKMAMERALAQLRENYGTERERFHAVIIDGNINYLPEELLAEAVIKADDSVPAVSAASIVAKVARDQYMEQMALTHPAYGFERHVGYGTAVHIAALADHGVTPLHRLSFAPIRKIVETSA
jgi:ribonuclease HII